MRCVARRRISPKPRKLRSTSSGACRPRSSNPVEELGVADLQALMRMVGESVTTEEAQDMARYMMALQGAALRRARSPDPVAGGLIALHL